MPLQGRRLTPLLQVYVMPVSIRFYRDVPGFEVVATSPILGEDRFHRALLRLGNAGLMLNTAYEFDSERPPSTIQGSFSRATVWMRRTKSCAESFHLRGLGI